MSNKISCIGLDVGYNCDILVSWGNEEVSYDPS